MGGVTTTDTGETLNSLNWVDMDEVIHAFHTLSPDQMTWACAKGERSAPSMPSYSAPTRHAEWVRGTTAGDIGSEMLHGAASAIWPPRSRC